MLDNLAALVAATTVLVLIPGPNVALIVANSLGFGLRSGLITVAGTSLGIAVQLFLVVAGMTALLALAASALLWIRWLGVAYLVYLGVKTWLTPAADLRVAATSSDTVTFLRGFLLAIVNPKTLLFNAAFLPQFLSDSHDPGKQLPVIALAFLLVVVAGDLLWAIFAASARDWIGRIGRWRNRIAGGFLIGAGLALALSRRSS